MNFQNRQKIVRQLLSNYRYVGEQFALKNPTVDVLARANLYYEQWVTETRFEGWFRLKDCANILITRGQWTFEGDKNIEELEKQIDILKMELYRNSFKSKQIKLIKAKLKSVRHSLNSLYIKRHYLDEYTWENFAIGNRQQFILDETIEYLGKNKNIRPSPTNVLTETQLREVARTSPWQTHWKIGKPNPFSCPVAEISDEQQVLILQSRMYDIVFEHPERPVDGIIDDDDMLDGWMIIQQKEQDQERSQQQIDKQLGGKHQGASDIFIPVSSMDDAKNINAMNTTQARMVKAQRERLIKAKGEVCDKDMLDKKLEIQQQRTEQFKQKFKK